MTADEVVQLFVVLTGYWRHSAPDVDDPIALAGYGDILAEVDLADAIDAARTFSRSGGHRFCPDPGELYAAVKARPAPVPPYHRRWEDDLLDPYPGETPEIEETTTSRVDVRALLDEARANLRGEAS